MISFTDTELYDYNIAMKMAKENGNTNVVQKLKKQSLPPYYGKGAVWKAETYYSYIGYCMGKNKNISNPEYTTLGEMAGPEYGLYDKLNYFLGLIKTYDRVYPQLYGIDFRKQSEKIDVSVYFFLGRYDINAPTKLAQEYYDKLKAPTQKLIWFEHSGHDA